MVQSRHPVPGEGSPFDVPPAAIGRYRVLHQIGAGSLGPVFRGEAPETRQPVAIKIFRLNLSPERSQRVAEALRDLIARAPRHDALVEVIDADVHDGEAFLVMSLAEGDSLDAALREFGPAAIVDALPRLHALAAALDEGAAANLWHGELQPRDIMVSADHTTLLGLGVGPALEQEGVALPARRTYTAPEIIDGAPSSPAGDQYALAAIAHEWLLGRRILGPSDTRRVDVPELPGVNRELLTAALKKALSPNAADRFASCDEFVAAVADSVKTRADGPLPVAVAIDHDDLPLAVAPQQPTLEWTPADVDPTPPPIEQDLPVHAFAPAFASVDPEPKGYGLGLLIATLAIGLGIGSIGGYLFGKQSASSVTSAPINATGDRFREAPVAPLPVVETPTVPIDDSPSRKTDAVPPRVAEASPPPTERPVPPPARPQLPAAVPAPPKPMTKSTSSTVLGRKPSPPPVVQNATGILVIESRPARASVSVDGRAVGMTPVTLSTIAAGTHTVTIDRPGYRRWTTTIQITAGQRARVGASLVEGQAQE